MQIISNERFEKLKLLFAYHDISLSDNDIALYSNAFEIISQFVNNKLTNEEIFAVYDLLSDVVKNQRPDIVSYVPKEDRIRVQVRLMEELEETKGKCDRNSIIIATLLHDLCKVKYDFPEEQGYYGHGSKSVQILTDYLNFKLTDEEYGAYIMALKDERPPKIIRETQE